MSTAWYWPGWAGGPLECSNPPEESCSDADCPIHGHNDPDEGEGEAETDDES
jgi:hypothetical protein